jgi:hypothetical protein
MVQLHSSTQSMMDIGRQGNGRYGDITHPVLQRSGSAIGRESVRGISQKRKKAYDAGHQVGC